jgi:large subunit ribosomal protein L29
MKASQIRELSPDEMKRKVEELKQELFNLRFQHAIGQLESPQKLKQTKRDVARVSTILRQRELEQTAN